MAEIEDEQEHIEQPVDHGNIDYLLAEYLGFDAWIGDLDTETECDKAEPWTDAGHKLLRVTWLLYVDDEHTDSHDDKRRVIYNKKGIIHFMLRNKWLGRALLNYNEKSP